MLAILHRVAAYLKLPKTLGSVRNQGRVYEANQSVEILKEQHSATSEKEMNVSRWQFKLLAAFVLLSVFSPAITPGVHRPHHKHVKPAPFVEFGLAEQIEWRSEWRAQQTQMCPDDEHITCSRFTVFI